MAIFRQTIYYKSRMPLRPRQRRNHHIRIMYKITVFLLGLNLLHARIRISRSNPKLSNKKDRSSQVTLHNHLQRSVQRSSIREHLQITYIHFLGNPRLPLESCRQTYKSRNSLFLNQRRKHLTNPITLVKHPPRSHWIFPHSYRHFQPIWTIVLV
jgi:hypothetical protein